jgi:hypothetical protein
VSSVLSRLKKKRGYPVDIDGETFHVRSLTIGELQRLDLLDADHKTGFVVGCALCSEANGEQELPRNADETDAAWADRVLAELADVPTDTIRALSDGVAAIGKTPATLEKIAKN